MKSLRRCVVSAGALALATAAGAQEAKAAGFANTNAGGEQGTVVSTNPMALYYNPGAMAFAKGSQLGLYGGLFIRHASYTRPGTANDYPEPPDAQAANVGTHSLFNAFGGPSIGGTLKVGNLVLGAGFFAPFGGRAHWGKNDAFENSAKYPLAAAGVQRWFAIDGATTILYFTAGAAYRFGPLSIGATGNFISSTVDVTTAKKPGRREPAGYQHEGRAFLDAHTFNGSFAAGLMLEPSRTSSRSAPRIRPSPASGSSPSRGSSMSPRLRATLPLHFRLISRDAARHLSGRHPVEAQAYAPRVSRLRRLHALEQVQVPVHRPRRRTVQHRRGRIGHHDGRAGQLLAPQLERYVWRSPGRELVGHPLGGAPLRGRIRDRGLSRLDAGARPPGRHEHPGDVRARDSSSPNRSS